MLRLPSEESLLTHKGGKRGKGGVLEGALAKKKEGSYFPTERKINGPVAKSGVMVSGERRHADVLRRQGSKKKKNSGFGKRKSPQACKPNKVHGDMKKKKERSEKRRVLRWSRGTRRVFARKRRKSGHNVLIQSMEGGKGGIITSRRKEKEKGSQGWVPQNEEEKGKRRRSSPHSVRGEREGLFS